MQVIDTGIDGLSLVLGGGLRLVSRVRDHGASGVVLIRGGPGTGKSVLAAHLAVAAAKALNTDALHACVELFPRELLAQLQQFTSLAPSKPDATTVDLVDLSAVPKVVAIEGRKALVAGLLELEIEEENKGHHPRLGDGIDKLINQAKSRGFKPGVIVIDSLIPGYGLGPETPRAFVDAVCKLFVERGLLGILIEESMDSAPGPWSFAVDTVLELGMSEGADILTSPTRTLRVLKHRFGASHVGLHVLSIRGEGIEVYPHIAAYEALRVTETISACEQSSVGWPWKIDEETADLPRFEDATVAVYGENSALVRRFASAFGHGDTNPRLPGAECYVGFEKSVGFNFNAPGQLSVLNVGGPQLEPEEWLYRARIHLERASKQHQAGLSRVVIGDLQSLRSFEHPEALRRAVMTLARMLRSHGVPVVLFETSPGARRWQANAIVGTDAAAPRIVDVADVVVEINQRTDDPTKPAETMVRWMSPDGPRQRAVQLTLPS